jgi:lipopolysaccharide export system permease protein
MTGRLPAYLRRRVGGQILVLLAVITALMQLLELLDVTTDVLKRDQGLFGLIYYGLLRLPSELVTALPMAVLLGAMMALNTMAKNLEIVTIRAAGISLMRMLGYLLPMMLVLAVLQFALSERVLPKVEVDLKEWWSATAPADEEKSRLWAHTNNGTVSIESTSPDGRVLKGIRVYVRNDAGLIASRLTAAEARWDGENWQLMKSSEVRIGEEKVAHIRDETRAWKTNLRPDDVLRLDNQRPRLSSIMIAEVIAGARAGTQPHRYYQTVFYRSFTAPLGVFVMLLLALPAAASLPRSANAGRQMVTGLVLGLGFLLCDGIVAALGTSSRWSPLVIALSAPVLFTAIGLLRLRACERT